MIHAVERRIKEIRSVLIEVASDIDDGISLSGDPHLETLLKELDDEIKFLRKILHFLKAH